MSKKNIYVIGGGVSGLMAATRAAELGANVVLMEKMDRPARKVLITGNGRCNITTSCDLKTSIAAFGPNGRFLHSAFSKFFSPHLIALLHQLDVPVKLESGNRYFPASDRAADVAEALIKRAVDAGVEIQTGKEVVEICASENRITGLMIANRTAATASAKEDCLNADHYDADTVILATGGLSYPKTGSTGDGFKFAHALGHTIIQPRAALTPIELHGNVHKALTPLSMKDTRISLIVNGRVIREEFGEMMFTHFGITGPAVINLSRFVPAEEENVETVVSIDFMPKMNKEQTQQWITTKLTETKSFPTITILEKIFTRKSAPIFLEYCGVPIDRKACETTKEERDRIVRLLKTLELTVGGKRPIEGAMITAGGVSLKEIDPRTMQSKIIKGLYICGETLDLDGPTGGFNLQAAFSTGWLAGESAALE